MRAGLLVEPLRLEIVEIDRPRPGPGEVVIAVRAALTCGTDLKTFLRGHPKWPTPTLLGHEFAGEISAVGSGVAEFREGDAVMAAPTGPCRACFWCARKQENLCETLMPEMVLGSYAEFVKLPSRVVRTNLFHKPTSLSWSEAALLEPLSCVLFGLAETAITAEDTAVILGGGPIGLLHLAVLRARGVENVWVVARKSLRAEAARDLGAARVLEADATEVEAVVREGTGGRGADLVVECTGRRNVWEAAPRLARRGGEVILFGGCPAGTEISFDAGRLHYDGVRLYSPFHFTPRAVREAFSLLESGRLTTAPFFTATTALEGLEAALRAMEQGTAIKHVVEP